MITRLGTDTVTRLRPAPADWRGDPTGPAAELAIAGCSVQPDGSQETNSGGDTVTTGHSLFAPPGTDITADDRVRLADGTEWAVDGEPAAWKDNLGRPHHVQAQLRRTEGR